jgi:hypothetical protein
MVLWWILSVVLWAAFLFLTATIAASKGRSGLLWGVIAVFLPLVSLVVVMLLPARDVAPSG